MLLALLGEEGAGFVATARPGDLYTVSLIQSITRPPLSPSVNSAVVTASANRAVVTASVNSAVVTAIP